MKKNCMKEAAYVLLGGVVMMMSNVSAKDSRKVLIAYFSRAGENYNVGSETNSLRLIGLLLIQAYFLFGINPGIPVSVTGLYLYCVLIPSRISFIASSGRAETSKFSLIRLGFFDVVIRAVPRWRDQASRTWAGVLLTRFEMVVMTGSSTSLGSMP